MAIKNPFKKPTPSPTPTPTIQYNKPIGPAPKTPVLSETQKPAISNPTLTDGRKPRGGGSSGGGSSSPNSYQDVLIVTEQNVNKPQEGITKIELVNPSTGRVIRTLKGNETVKFTPYDSYKGLNVNEKLMAGVSPREILLPSRPNALTTQIERFNTINILQNDKGQAKGIEYRGKSYTPLGFEKEFGIQLLFDPKKQEYFFGTARQSFVNPTRIATGLVSLEKPLTTKEKLFIAKTRGDEKRKFDYENIKVSLLDPLDEGSRLLKAKAVYALNNSDFNTGNKAVDITTNTLGKISYFGGSAGAYALNMVSGVGNIFNEFALKPKETSINLLKSTPAMLTASFSEINRTLRGQGTVEDFFGSALTLTMVAKGLTSVGKLASGTSTRKLVKYQDVIKETAKQSEKLLKKEQFYLQKTFVKSADKWTTFGKARQVMNGMNARHSWISLTQGKKSTILQKTIIKNKNVTMTHVMASRSSSDKLFRFLTSIKNKQLGFVENFTNNKRISTYLSKAQTKRLYTFVEIKGAKFVSAIDGKGNVFILKNQAQVNNFIRNAKFGKFSFSGKKAIGGNIETIARTGKNSFIGTEAFKTKKLIGLKTSKKELVLRDKSKQIAFRKTKGITLIEKSPKRKVTLDYRALKIKPFKSIKDVKVKPIKKVTIDFKEIKKRPPKAEKMTFSPSSKLLLKESLENLKIGDNLTLSKQISNTAVSSQLKQVSKAISKSIAKDLAIRQGFKAVVGASGLVFLSKSGKIVSPKVATKNKQVQLSKIGSKVDQILDSAGLSKQASTSAQKLAQKSATKQATMQKTIKRTALSSPTTRVSVKIRTDVKPRTIILPSDDPKNKIVKKILGDKLAPSYQIAVGSGKKVRYLKGRYSPKDAISKGAYDLDRSEKRTVRIVPSKLKPNKKFNRDYLKEADKKFRNYRYRQGKKVSYSATRLIEKRKYFNDLEKLGRKRKLKGGGK